MFEPGDRVKITNTEGEFTPEELAKEWTVISYPWKCWQAQMVTVGDENGLEKAVNINDLSKVEQPSEESGHGCNKDYCDIR